jgi:hypothetical protein
MKFLYDRRGEPVAFLEGQYIYTMAGVPTGYVQAPHVYRLAGDYVGELYMDMIVDQYLSNPGGIGRVTDPGRVSRADYPGNRGPVDYGYPDAIHKLFED